MAENRSAVSARERIAFALGDTGFNFIWQTIEIYLLYYYIRVDGLSPSTAAGIFFAGAVADLICDPLIGAIVDMTSHRIKIMSWLMIAGLPLGIALAGAFITPPASPGTGVLIIAVLHVTMRLLYSLGNIPYAVLTSRISPDPQEHVRLTSARMQGAAAGGIVTALIYLTLPLNRGWHGVPLGAILLGLAAQPMFLATYAGVRLRVALPPSRQRGLWSYLGEYRQLIRGSRALRALLILILFTGISVTVLNKSLLFLFEHIGRVRWGYMAALIPPLSLFIGAPLWTRQARRYGTVRILTVAAALHGLAVGLAWWVMGGALASRTLMELVLVSLAIYAAGGVSTLFWALVPDVVDACEAGLATDGCAARIFGLADLARKLGQALAPQVIALSLMTPGHSVLPGTCIAALVALAVALLAGPRIKPAVS